MHDFIDFFTGRQHSLLCRALYYLRSSCTSVRPSVSLSVCHTLALCQNDAIFTNGQPKVSSFDAKKLSQKFKRVHASEGVK